MAVWPSIPPAPPVFKNPKTEKVFERSISFAFPIAIIGSWILVSILEALGIGSG